MLTHAQLKELIFYDPENGILKKRKTGKILGSKISRDGYIRIRLRYKLYLAHRLAWLYMTGQFPKDQIDHINHNRSDNRFVNLREATNQENAKNRKPHIKNKSKISGVSWDKKSNKWRSEINNKNKKIYLGLFDDKFEAICIRKSTENKLGYHQNHGL